MNLEELKKKYKELGEEIEKLKNKNELKNENILPVYKQPVDS